MKDLATEVDLLINEAASMLRDKLKRQAYDADLLKLQRTLIGPDSYPVASPPYAYSLLVSSPFPYKAHAFKYLPSGYMVANYTDVARYGAIPLPK